MKIFTQKKLILLALLPMLFFMVNCSGSEEIAKIVKVEKEAGSQWFNPDTVKAGKFDIGKMWTFEDAPVDYFAETYNFKPTQQWLDKVRMSSLRFATWCSSSYVSEDGLLMTNHHCVDFILDQFQQEGEDIPRDGFYAPSLEDERRVPNLFVEQLILIKDVTSEVVSAINAGKNEAERLENKNTIVTKLQNEFSEETGLRCQVTSLYNGGKYSMYGYRRYDDVRVVMVVERVVGLYGGDPDNFTYPRYDADFAFLRVYDENGHPVKTDNFFKFSDNGPVVGEPLFVIGNPGTTQKLKTYAQLEYYRDVDVRNLDFQFNRQVQIFTELAEEYPEKATQYHGAVFLPANSGKVFKYRLEALRDPYFMARKKAFEAEFKKGVNANPELKAKYGRLWDGIANLRSELKEFGNRRAAYNINSGFNSQHFVIARTLVAIADELKKPEAERSEDYKRDKLNEMIDGLFPATMDEALQYKTLAMNADFITMNLGQNDPLVKKTFGGKLGKAAADYVLKNSVCKSKDDVIALVNKGADAIYNSGDLLIQYVLAVRDDLSKFNQRNQEILNTEQALEDQLGQALYAVYGTSIPPDATFTLRISDGIMKSYEYNGTMAPVETTFHGLYDRYYGHQKQYPWDLPERWVNYDSDFDLNTPYNFISTHDIVGGSSGSAVINADAEIVGIAFDGNVESIPGNYIFIPDQNRMVSVSSTGIIEIIRDLFKYERLAKELEAGKIVVEEQIDKDITEDIK